MRIASRWAKTGSLKVLGDTQHPWQHVLRLGHIQATRRCRGIRDRAVWQAVWNSAVFRCISLYDAPYMYHASSRLPPGAIQPYSAIQRHTALYEHTAIQHHTAYTPYNTPQLYGRSPRRRWSPSIGQQKSVAGCRSASHQRGPSARAAMSWQAWVDESRRLATPTANHATECDESSTITSGPMGSLATFERGCSVLSWSARGHRAAMHMRQ